MFNLEPQIKILKKVDKRSLHKNLDTVKDFDTTMISENQSFKELVNNKEIFLLTFDLPIPLVRPRLYLLSSYLNPIFHLDQLFHWLGLLNGK